MRKETILVIEDNAKNMRLCRILLKKGQYEILEATNAEEGIAMAGRRKPVLILMDIQLPGMNGLDLHHQIAADPALAAIPCVLLTAYDQGNQRRDALAAGFAAYLTKPVRRATLLRAVARACGRGGEEEVASAGPAIDMAAAAPDRDRALAEGS